MISVFFANYYSMQPDIIRVFNARNCIRAKDQMPMEGKVTYAMVQDVWNHRTDEDYLLSVTKSFRQDMYWIFHSVIFYKPIVGVDIPTCLPKFNRLFDKDHFF
jgi:hypothetical protein